MSLIECSFEECGDGDCLKKCVQACGGAALDVANFACSAGGIACVCRPADSDSSSGAPMWVYIVVGAVGGLILLIALAKLCRARQTAYQSV
jgi:hypothetical protein